VQLKISLRRHHKDSALLHLRASRIARLPHIVDSRESTEMALSPVEVERGFESQNYYLTTTHGGPSLCASRKRPVYQPVSHYVVKTMIHILYIDLPSTGPKPSTVAQDSSNDGLLPQLGIQSFSFSCRIFERLGAPCKLP
jgi:hypothetical protein